MGISTVADLNERITKGNIQQMMLIAEALQEQKIAKIAEQIAEKKTELAIRQAELQKATDAASKECDKLGVEKEKEVMSV